MPVTVLLVDDSAVVRGLITKALSSDPTIAICGNAVDGVAAIEAAKKLQPDIIILDIEMPQMDGITALPKLLQISPKSKIIMASTLTVRNASISLQALSLGASDYVAKPSARGFDELNIFYRELISKIHALAVTRATIPTPGIAAASSSTLKTPAKPYPTLLPGIPLNPKGISALAIASSTGGPQALISIFTQIKGGLKRVPIFITQHMPPTFTTILADHISKAGNVKCSEAKNGEIAEAGRIYLAPGNFHMTVAKNGAGQYIISTNQEPQENFCRPSADPMLRSLSQAYGANLAVAVLTGMGQDGLEGAKVVVKNGGSVIAQDEATSTVYGMPKAVFDNNLCKCVLPLNEIGSFLVRQIDGQKTDGIKK